MITLEKEFESGSGGFASAPHWFEQVKRSDKVALYQRSVEKGGKIVGYEVFKILIDPKGKANKFPNGVVKIVEDDTEKYPANSSFGKTAWFCMNMERAELVFERISNSLLQVTVDESETNEDNENEDSSVPSSGPRRGRPKVNHPPLKIPEGEFSCTELATFNGIEYSIAFVMLKQLEGLGSVRFSREERRASRGKPTRLFAKS